MSVHVLGIDPGFRMFGWSVVDVYPDRFKVLHCGLIRTEKAKKKARVNASDDDHRCSKEIHRALVDLCETHNIKMLVAEGISMPPNVVSALKMARVWGVISALCESLVLPLAEATPKQIKKTLCGRSRVKDSDLHNEVMRRYPETRRLVEQAYASTLREHMFDSVGAIEACRESEVFMTMRSMARGD